MTVPFSCTWVTSGRRGGSRISGGEPALGWVGRGGGDIFIDFQWRIMPWRHMDQIISVKSCCQKLIQNTCRSQPCPQHCLHWHHASTIGTEN